jgi:alginate O-acetyltransferase complex protein AlgI
MLFNSINFILFLPVVFILYWFAGKENSKKKQNVILLAASYFFYGSWDYRFLFLLLFSTLLDYFLGLQIAASNKQRVRKQLLFASIGINLGFLGLFKYYNFFAASFADALSSIGVHASFSTLNVVLPVGISFYTFHGLSYIIDVYRNRIAPEKNLVDYGLFVSFFPLLVAGPIERATHLLPQLKQNRQFNYSQGVDGLKQILWGFFKKLVIADNCATYVNLVFDNSAQFNGSSHVLAAVFFSIQIYADFSGYSDIALGTARLFGIELLQNFSFPYFSRDIAEFWRRWHISLTSWFRDYVYIPLGGSRVSTLKKIRNVFIIFLLSGFWHGANWTFLFWGMLNAIYFIPLLLLNRNRNNLTVIARGKILPSVSEFIQMFLTFGLATFAWIFFRSQSVSAAFGYISHIFSRTLFLIPQQIPYLLLLHTLFFFSLEWLARDNRYAIETFGSTWKKILRWSFYSFLIFYIGVYMATVETPFIYFQF